MTEKFDDVFVDFAAEEGCGATRSQGACGDLGGWDASVGLASTSGRFEGRGDVFGLDVAELAFFGVEVVVKRS